MPKRAEHVVGERLSTLALHVVILSNRCRLNTLRIRVDIVIKIRTRFDMNNDTCNDTFGGR